MIDPIARQLAHFHGNDHYGHERVYPFPSWPALT
jgi:hypothetical protein